MMDAADRELADDGYESLSVTDTRGYADLRRYGMIGRTLTKILTFVGTCTSPQNSQGHPTGARISFATDTDTTTALVARSTPYPFQRSRSPPPHSTNLVAHNPDEDAAPLARARSLHVNPPQYRSRVRHEDLSAC